MGGFDCPVECPDGSGELWVVGDLKII